MNWRDITGYEGTYQVSDEGNIRRILKDGSTKPVKNRPSANYYTVSLSQHGIKKTVAVHRVVAETFLDRKPDLTEVNHKDGNKFNNRVSNLEWVTAYQNVRHAIEELGKNPFGKPARKVKCVDPKTGRTVAEYKSITEAAKALGKISARASISNVCQGYQNSAYGYKWEYSE